jgi:hypothetical protein
MLKDKEIMDFAGEMLDKHGYQIVLFNSKRWTGKCISNLIFIPTSLKEDISRFKKMEQNEIISQIKKKIFANWPKGWKIYFPLSKRYATNAEMSEFPSNDLEEFQGMTAYEAIISAKDYMRMNSRIKIDIALEIHAIGKKDKIIPYFIVNNSDMKVYYTPPEA